MVLVQAADEWLERWAVRQGRSPQCQAQERGRGPTASSQVLLEGQGLQRGNVGRLDAVRGHLVAYSQGSELITTDLT